METLSWFKVSSVFLKNIILILERILFKFDQKDFMFGFNKILF
jgi:hypothetical protein